MHPCGKERACTACAHMPHTVPREQYPQEAGIFAALANLFLTTCVAVHEIGGNVREEAYHDHSTHTHATHTLPHKPFCRPTLEQVSNTSPASRLGLGLDLCG